MTNKRKLQRVKCSQAKGSLGYHHKKRRTAYVHNDMEMFYDPITSTFFNVRRSDVVRISLTLDGTLIPRAICKIKRNRI